MYYYYKLYIKKFQLKIAAIFALILFVLYVQCTLYILLHPFFVVAPFFECYILTC